MASPVATLTHHPLGQCGASPHRGPTPPPLMGVDCRQTHLGARSAPAAMEPDSPFSTPPSARRANDRAPAPEATINLTRREPPTIKGGRSRRHGGRRYR
jgi:hypothetical protein